MKTSVYLEDSDRQIYPDRQTAILNSDIMADVSRMMEFESFDDLCFVGNIIAEHKAKLEKQLSTDDIEAVNRFAQCSIRKYPSDEMWIRYNAIRDKLHPDLWPEFYQLTESFKTHARIEQQFYAELKAVSIPANFHRCETKEALAKYIGVDPKTITLRLKTDILWKKHIRFDGKHFFRSPNCKQSLTPSIQTMKQQVKLKNTAGTNRNKSSK